MEFSDKVLGGYISKLINIRRFKEDNAHEVNQIKMSKITDRIIFSKLKSINPDIDYSNMASDIKLCEAEIQKYNFQDFYDSPETLNARTVLPMYEYDSINSDLKTLKMVKSDLYQTKRTKLYTPFPTFTPRGNIVPNQTLLITVSLYYPFHWMKNQVPDEAVIPHCKDVIQFHDTQTLEDLKQAFRCENIYSEISGDISESPHKPLEYIASYDLKHGLFYINNNIYVDSVPDGITRAHAETMSKWAHCNGRTISNILPMKTQLLDLEVCIGQPYVYQHLGRCEHLIIFNEIRFAQANDCLGQNNYPRVISEAKEKLKSCMFCNKSIASVVMVCDDDRTPVTVNHMCDSCFLSYNYDHIGDKIANYKAYRTLKWKK